MEAPGGSAGGTGGAEGHEDGQGGHRILAGQGGPEIQDVLGVAAGVGAERANIGGIPHVGLVPLARALPVARRQGRHLHEFTLRVPFLCPIEAEVAERSLATYEEHLAVHREFTVDGSFLIVSWIAEDPRSLQTSFTSFLDHLSQLLRTMQHFGPLFPPASLLGKGG
uniref:EKC/KEOPS complex subunit LAGE3-like n=1 Tax=Ictidomys tridecemlineatus TaxID=43179 RepID=UPI001A9CC45E|nr:EKC/KEOPS complex subunit LAGE3-like [Ictidomys tridecemlineatus]